METATRLFELGNVCATPGALSALNRTGTRPSSLLDRHQLGDWGTLDAEDRRENDWSVNHEARILSAYHLSDGTKLWIITEADRSVTTLLEPSEY
jgi:hypothetical protein